jgi:hypothetical protein
MSLTTPGVVPAQTSGRMAMEQGTLSRLREGTALGIGGDAGGTPVPVLYLHRGFLSFLAD